jgi:hypothetical protein
MTSWQKFNLLSLVMLSFYTPAFAQQPPQDPPVGTYKCWTASDYLAPNDSSVKGLTQNTTNLNFGICRYQAGPLDSVYGDLLKEAQTLFPLYNKDGDFNSNDKSPHQGMGRRTIEWWYQDARMNEIMGKHLMLHDREYAVETVPKVLIEFKIHTFESGYERELGYDVAAFYGRRQVQTEKSNGAANYNNVLGIFRNPIALLSPLADYLTLGIKASIEKKKGEELFNQTFDCYAGVNCFHGNPADNFFKGNIEVKTGVRGLNFETTAHIDPSNPNRVLLRNLDISYGISTGIDNSPVEKHIIRQTMDLILNVGETYVLGSSITTRDMKTGQILDRGTEHSFTQNLTEIRVWYPNSNAALLGNSQVQNINELQSIPNSALEKSPIGLTDFFNSIKLVCFDDHISGTNQKVCGFQFSRLDRKTAGYRLQFSLAGNLKYSYKSAVTLLASDVFEGYGYYQIPIMDDSDSGKYFLNISIDSPDLATQLLMKAEKVRGVTLAFRHYPNTPNNPVGFSAEDIKIQR